MIPSGLLIFANAHAPTVVCSRSYKTRVKSVRRLQSSPAHVHSTKMPCAASSPVLSLPPELLARIILWGKRDIELEALLSGDLEYLQRDDLHQKCAAVCSAFRSVVFSTALLWNAVTIRPTSILEKVEAYCLRSGSAPLDIHVQLTGPWYRYDHIVDSVFKALDIIIRHSARWRSLSISLGREPNGKESVVDLLCSCPAPLLEHLSLSVDDVDLAKLNKPTALHPCILPNNPDMSFARFRGLALYFVRPFLGRLTVLHLDQTKHTPLSFELFKELLTASVNLEHLSLFGLALANANWPRATQGSPPIHLPALKSLRISGRDAAAFPGVLSNIDAPLLHACTFRDMVDDDLACPSLAHTSLPQVKHLVFTNFQPSEVAYRTITRIFPSVEVFHSTSTTIGASRCYRLLCREADSKRWPNLRTMRFGFDPLRVEGDDAPDAPQIMHELHRLRGEIGCPTINFEFLASKEYEEEILEYLEQVVELVNDIEVKMITDVDMAEIWPPGEADTHYQDFDDTLFMT